jgi:hypothetical protein
MQHIVFSVLEKETMDAETQMNMLPLWEDMSSPSISYLDLPWFKRRRIIIIYNYLLIEVITVDLEQN